LANTVLDYHRETDLDFNAFMRPAIEMEIAVRVGATWVLTAPRTTRASVAPAASERMAAFELCEAPFPDGDAIGVPTQVAENYGAGSVLADPADGFDPLELDRGRGRGARLPLRYPHDREPREGAHAVYERPALRGGVAASPSASQNGVRPRLRTRTEGAQKRNARGRQAAWLHDVRRGSVPGSDLWKR
jgi:hypothetical protein